MDAKSPRAVSPYSPMPERLRALRAEVPRAPMQQMRFDLADAVGNMPVLRIESGGMMARDLSKFADRLQDRLIECGFVVHRYNATSTRSVYLKLDYGACGSIRISDHEGSRHLKYRWNVGTWIQKERHGAGRSYYPCKLVERMVEAICSLREKRVTDDDYAWRVRYGKQSEKKKASRFWSKACHVEVE